MDRIARAQATQRAELFSETAARMSITAAAAEKDFWIVWTLQQLFSLPHWANRLRFKGGTSLSKAYGLIERFSEDIDLILDWNSLTEQEPTAERSNTKQQQLNRSINTAAQLVICEELLPAIQAVVAPICKAMLDEYGPHTINIEYPALFASGYLRPVVRLEIGPLAAMLPFGSSMIKSYSAEYFPLVFEQPSVLVPTIKAERTFWEKATILHAEAHRPIDKRLPARYARHYYDVHRMAATAVAEQALADTCLLAEVVVFKKKFYPANWANYDAAKPSGFRLLPRIEHKASLHKDYLDMKEMIFGDIPSFEVLLNDLAALEKRINQLSSSCSPTQSSPPEIPPAQ
ncbi:MAG: nucleotidyl transferase AbiEii/AbiGii toxin family protein [Pseudomonas sp.]|nr:nucleotidyl transferase AbiEii/AbiGii toxin family protein [Pseudomonas sp.]